MSAAMKSTTPLFESSSPLFHASILNMRRTHKTNLSRYPLAIAGTRLQAIRSSTIFFSLDPSSSDNQTYFFLTNLNIYSTEYIKNTMYSFRLQNDLKGDFMKKETKKVSFDCPVDVLERLDKLSDITDLPRQKLISNLVSVGVETIEDCHKVGLLQFSLLVRNMRDHLKTWSKEMREKTDLEGLE